MRNDIETAAATASLTIPPLAWEHVVSEVDEEWSAPTPQGDYLVHRNRKDYEPGAPWEGWQWHWAPHNSDGSRDFTDCANPDDGKAQAAAHHAKREARLADHRILIPVREVLTEEQERRCRAEAKARGMTLSSFVEAVLRAGLSKEEGAG